MNDRFEIVETCSRMAWYADQRDWDALIGVFAEKVLLDYSSLNGGDPVSVTPHQIAAAWANALGGFDATQHLITNHLVTVSGDKAACTAAFQATHRLANPHGGPLWTLGGNYRFDLLCSVNGWRITGVVMTATWAEGNQHIMALAAEKAGQ